MATSLVKSKQWKLGTLALVIYDIDVTHNLSVAGTFTVTGTQAFTGNTTVGGNLAVTGTSVFTGAITVTGGLRVPVATVAAAGTTVTDATQLGQGLSIVTGANGTVGVKLPATPAAGTVVFIKGTTSGTLKIWPDAAATINAIGSNGAYTTGTVAPVMLIAASTTQWYTFPLVAS